MARRSQCGHCGHLFSDDHPYYSEDFAAYFCPQPMFSLTWCLHCTYVSIHKRTGLQSLLRAPIMKFQKVVPLDKLSSEPLGKIPHPEMKGFAVGHLVRMAWHALNARVALDTGEENHEAAVHLAMTKMPPGEVALMVMTTVHANQMIPLEHQIQEGLYLGDKLNVGTGPFRQWIQSSKRREHAKETLERLDGFEERMS